jgi:hypothetical protein
MIINFTLKTVLNLIHNNRIDPKFLNSAATPNVLSLWDKFMFANFKLRSEIKQRINRTHRIDFGFIDRTGTIPSVLNVTIPPDQLIPEIDPKQIKQQYVDICMDRARRLLAQNRQINVLWSGGVDSTVALFSLLRSASNLDQINLYCSIESIMESGGMYDRYIKPLGIRVKFNQVRVKGVPFTFDHEDPDQLYVSGDNGDHIFGPRNFFSLPNQLSTDPWYAGYSNDLLDLTAPTIEKSPRKIETAADFKWWLEFNFCWISGYNDSKGCMPATIADRICPFYATPEFQTWSMTNDWWPGLTGQYRQPAKDALATMIDYDYYINNKSKGQSLWIMPGKKWYMTDTDYNHYYLP